MTEFTSEGTFVAVLDILGFNEIVTNTKHSDLKEIYDKLFSDNVKFSLAVSQIQSLKIKYEIDVRRQDITMLDIMQNALKKDLKEPAIHCILVSDSIILWTKESEYHEFLDFVSCISYLIHHSFKNGLPLRGTITYGPLTVKYPKKEDASFHESTCFGLSITNAYKRSIRQNWAGCVLDEHCVAKINKKQIPFPASANIKEFKMLSVLDILTSFDFLLRYKTPYKDGAVKNEFVINWAITNEDLHKIILKSFTAHGKKLSDWPAQMKCDNTIKFYDHIIDKKKHHG